MDKISNIQNAIKAEEEYLKGTIDLPLAEILQNFEYTDLETYFKDKAKYLLYKENLNVQSFTMEEGINRVFSALDNGIAGAFTVKESFPRTWIWAGRNNIYLNTERAVELNYSITNFNYDGGPIITTNDDFSLALVVPKSIDIDIQTLIDEIIFLLNKKGYNAIQDKNDLLINGYKVFGAIVHGSEKCHLFAFQLSLVPHNQIIKELSLKEAIKIPSYVPNLTREEVEEEINQWLHTI